MSLLAAWINRDISTRIRRDVGLEPVEVRLRESMGMDAMEAGESSFPRIGYRPGPRDILSTACPDSLSLVPIEEGLSKADK